MRSVLLVVPQLVPEPADALSSAFTLNRRFAALHRLLVRARPQHQPSEHASGWLCEAFGVRVADGDWPVAALTLLAEGHEPGTDVWLRADPVHLQARQSELVLVGSDRLGVSAAEAAALIESLNRHFAEDGLTFLAAAPQRWCVRTAQPARMRTTPVDQAEDHSIDALLPRGPDALAWHRRANEVQMLLHAHPVNEAREVMGIPPINSVWFWGAGPLPRRTVEPAPSIADATVWADDALARGLALYAHRPLHALPDAGETWLAQAANGRHLIVFDPLAGAAQPAAWEQRAAHLDAAWLRPLLRALSRGTLRELTLITQHAGSVLSFALSRADLWKLWRRSHSLARA